MSAGIWAAIGAIATLAGIILKWYFSDRRAQANEEKGISDEDEKFKEDVANGNLDDVSDALDKRLRKRHRRSTG